MGKKCLYCGNEILPKEDTAQARYEVKRKKFCNHSCAASYTNSKREKKNLCLDCGKPVSNDVVRCSKCNRVYMLQLLEARTLEDVKSKGNARVSWSTVRKAANRKLELNNIEKKCVICGIDEPIDCCHIKSITEFPLDTLVSEVNALSNLTYMCKNHHWLFDHNKIDINGAMV